MKDKIAFVLAGGGAKGAYQIGVWRAFHENGIEPDIVTGTSIGAFNGALIVQGDLKKAWEIWENMDSATLLGLEKENKSGKLEAAINITGEAIEQKGISTERLKNFLDENIDENKIRDSKIEYGIVTVEVPDFKPLRLFKEEISKGKLNEYILSSASIFPALKYNEMDGKKFIDGGYMDNRPENMAADKGATTIYSIELRSKTKLPKIIGMRPYKGDEAKVVLIQSQWDLGSFYFTDSTLALRNLNLGYMDGLKTLGKVKGTIYAITDETGIYSITGEFQKLLRKISPDKIFKIDSPYLKLRDLDFEEETRNILLLIELLSEMFQIDPTRKYTLYELKTAISVAFSQFLTDISSKNKTEFTDFLSEIKNKEFDLSEKITSIFSEKSKNYPLSLFLVYSFYKNIQELLNEPEKENSAIYEKFTDIFSLPFYLAVMLSVIEQY